MVKDLASPAWTLTLRAIAYSAGPQPDHRSAVSKEDLIKLVAVCDTDPSLVPLRVALVFGFLGYLRISYLAPPTAQSFDPARHSSWADVRPYKQGLLLDFKWTKTLQTQQGVTTIPLAALQDQRICPIATWNLYKHTLPWVASSKTTPLLLTKAPPVGKTISASTLRAMFHRATQAAGLADKNYTPHSLRRGGGELLSVSRPESPWSTSKSTALGLPRRSTGTYCSTRPSRPQWHRHFGRLSLDPRVRILKASRPDLPSGIQVRTSKAPGPVPATTCSHPTSNQTSMFHFSASARPQYCSPRLGVTIATIFSLLLLQLGHLQAHGQSPVFRKYASQTSRPQQTSDIRQAGPSVQPSASS